MKDRCERTGNWLFRWRSYLPLVMIGLVILAMRERGYQGQQEMPSHIWEAICFTVSLTGLGIRILTIGYTSRGTSGRNRNRQLADTLNTTGMYSIVRNPLYLGNFFIGLGLSLFACQWWLIVIYILAFWLYYERIIFAEEGYLIDKFGDEYLSWVRETPAFIPRFRNYKKPQSPFSYRKVLRHEYNSLLTFILAFFVLEVASDLLSWHTFELDVGWAVILTIGLLVWITLRTLKKRTSLLRGDGR